MAYSEKYSNLPNKRTLFQIIFSICLAAGLASFSIRFWWHLYLTSLQKHYINWCIVIQKSFVAYTKLNFKWLKILKSMMAFGPLSPLLKRLCMHVCLFNSHINGSELLTIDKKLWIYTCNNNLDAVKCISERRRDSPQIEMISTKFSGKKKWNRTTCRPNHWNSCPVIWRWTICSTYSLFSYSSYRHQPSSQGLTNTTRLALLQSFANLYCNAASW